MTILLHKHYLVKVTTKGGGAGGQNRQKFDYVVDEWSLRDIFSETYLALTNSAVSFEKKTLNTTSRFHKV